MKESSHHSGNATFQGEIARTAYQLWDEAGRPRGHNMEFWLKAEQQHTAIGRLLLPNSSINAESAAKNGTADPDVSGTPAPAADQAHAEQFFESLRSIKFTNAPKLPAASAPEPVAAALPTSTRIRKPEHRAGTGKSRPKEPAASAKAVRNGK
jgi:hypothetical protein